MERSATRERSRALVPVLLGALALTVLSSLVSTALVTEQRARSIEDAAESISTNAMPSIEHLAGARGDLRHMEGLLIEYVHRLADRKDASDLVPQIRRVRAQMAESWDAEKHTPLYPGERLFWDEIDAATAAVDAAADRILAVTRREDASVHDLIHGSLQPAVDRLADVLLADIQFHARYAHDAAETIAAARTRQRTLATVLEITSALFALIAGAAVAHALHRYMVMTDERIAELDMFAARVAHDLQNPLMTAGYAIELARRRCADDPTTLATLDRGARSTQRAGQLVKALLALASAGEPSAPGAKVEVRALAAGELDELAAAARAKGVALSLDPFDPVEVACCPGVLGSVLANLIGNAIKYIGDAPDRRVRVGARTVGPWVRIEVVDTGPGVPASLRDRVFDPFVRAASSSIPGLGLGLATVRRMVAAHGGKVGVEAVPEGGSRFWVELPKAAAP